MCMRSPVMAITTNYTALIVDDSAVHNLWYAISLLQTLQQLERYSGPMFACDRLDQTADPESDVPKHSRSIDMSQALQLDADI
jgi:hypothetical protein